MHQAPNLAAKYTLEEKSGYSLLVPSISTQTTDADFQTSVITLPGGNQDRTSSLQCIIQGPVFSLAPDRSGKTKWLVKSFSVQGWQRRAGDLDMHAEWIRFTRDLRELEHRSCFPATEDFFTVRRAIAESIPVPANESAFFLYSFGGTGFVDLAPTMQIKLERPLVQSDSSTTHSTYKGSLVADYAVTSTNVGVALHLLKTADQRAAKSLSADPGPIFSLSNRFAAKPILRLFLQSLHKDNSLQPAILIGANDVHDLETATEQIEKSGRAGCPATSSTAIECISFASGTAVSLLSPMRVNGKPELRPFGTTMAYILDTQSHNALDHALQTASLRRHLVRGGYAEVEFPRTLDAVAQIILLPNDVLAWKN
jgi:hypothetical protein